MASNLIFQLPYKNSYTRPIKRAFLATCPVARPDVRLKTTSGKMAKKLKYGAKICKAIKALRVIIVTQCNQVMFSLDVIYMRALNKARAAITS